VDGETITLEYGVVRQETHKAIQVILAVPDCRFFWFPKKLCKPELQAGMRDGIVRIPLWLWREKAREWHEEAERCRRESALDSGQRP
jgi:hypothetical protein